MALASDLRWLISEGHVIEFNDGSLDLPRVKVPQPQGTAKTARKAAKRSRNIGETTVAEATASNTHRGRRSRQRS